MPGQTLTRSRLAASSPLRERRAPDTRSGPQPTVIDNDSNHAARPLDRPSNRLNSGRCLPCITNDVRDRSCESCARRGQVDCAGERPSLDPPSGIDPAQRLVDHRADLTARGRLREKLAHLDHGCNEIAAAEPLQTVDPVAAEAALALRRSGALRRSRADPKALRRALRRIEELLDE